MEPIRELPPARLRLAPLLGAVSAAFISGLVHAAFLVLLGIVIVPAREKSSELEITATRDWHDDDLVELVSEQVQIHSLPIERHELETRESLAGNESLAIDIGGVPETRLFYQIHNKPGDFCLLDIGLRRALLQGAGGPGTGSGRGGEPAESAFHDMIDDAREYGLDIVLAMDTTGSMGGEIETVKRRIVGIGGALLKKVPDARISIVSYKDHGDDYVVKGISLTSDLTDLQKFLAKIKAGGGGDPPEAVEEGLKWALANNDFRPSARKVILLFGDRPPHEEDHPLCVSLASQFRNDQNGIVSTITCRQNYPIPHFVQISRAGGGEAFILKDSRRIMEELLVLLFGNRHRKDVVAFFELDVGDERPAAALDEGPSGLGLLSGQGEDLLTPRQPGRRKK